MYIANLDVDTIDVGVPVLSMHAPYEVVSKIDIYMAYKSFPHVLYKISYYAKSLSFTERLQRVEKGVHLEKMQFYTLRRLREKRAGFCILRGRTYIGTPLSGSPKSFTTFWGEEAQWNE